MDIFLLPVRVACKRVEGLAIWQDFGRFCLYFTAYIGPTEMTVCELPGKIHHLIRWVRFPNRIHQVAPMCLPCLLPPIRVHNPNGMSIGSVIFPQLTVGCCRVWPGSGHVGLVSSKNFDFTWVIWTPSITYFFTPIRVQKPNAISIGSDVLPRYAL